MLLDMMSYGYAEVNGVVIDWTYLMVIAMALISVFCSWKVNSTFNKYTKVQASLTGTQAAATLLQANGITDVQIGRVSGNLTDHYSPSDKVLNLSDSTYGVASVAAVGVAAHECGHAIQHKVGYGPLVLRSTIVPLANIGSKLGIPIIFLGWILSFSGLATLGIIVFSLSVFFTLVTLPVEFNASHRAVDNLRRLNLMNERELDGVKKVLTAAAMTYVASAASSVVYLLRFIMLNRRRND